MTKSEKHFTATLHGDKRFLGRILLWTVRSGKAAGPAGCRFNMLSKRGNFKRWNKPLKQTKSPVKVSVFILLCKARCLESSFAVRGAELNFYSSVWSPESCKQGARRLAHLIMCLSAFFAQTHFLQVPAPPLQSARGASNTNSACYHEPDFYKHTHTHKRRVFTCATIAASFLTLSSCTLRCHSAATATPPKKTKQQKYKNKTKTRLCAPAARPPAPRSQTSPDALSTAGESAVN